jgi:hypothetical protein
LYYIHMYCLIKYVYTNKESCCCLFFRWFVPFVLQWLNENDDVMLFLYSKRLHEQKNITTVNSVTNTWSIQQTPRFHGCTITNKTKRWALKNFDVMGPHQGFIYMLLTFKLLKLFRKQPLFFLNTTSNCIK